MTNFTNPFEPAEQVPASLARSSSTTNLASLSSEQPIPREPRQKKSGPISHSELSTEDKSEDSQVLYTAKRNDRRGDDRSFSAISNASLRRMDGSSDAKDNIQGQSATEERSWDIIDREIFEWQYVCRTGRPYWWSSESKYHRLKKLQPRIPNETTPRVWTRDIEASLKPYSERRRAISETYLSSDHSDSQDVAHLVAIQLLSACFTLPPDHTIGISSPNYAVPKKDGTSAIPDPRMISCLRMHTHFRYSPSFGHQARNSSPVLLRPLLCESPSCRTSPSSSSRDQVMENNGISNSPLEQRHAKQPLNVTKDSAYTQSLASDVDQYFGQGRDELNSNTTVGCLQDDFNNIRKSKQRPSTVSGSSGEEEIELAGTYQGAQMCNPQRAHYRLQPVIRSEPHPLFVQPIRELVVKRWKSLRRRFGGSLHSPFPASLSEDQTSTSESSMSDGRVRRRRAQERGDIISSSVDSVTHYNSPASGQLTPSFSAPIPIWIDSKVEPHNSLLVKLGVDPTEFVGLPEPKVLATSHGLLAKGAGQWSEMLYKSRVHSVASSPAPTICETMDSRLDLPFLPSTHSTLQSESSPADCLKSPRSRQKSPQISMKDITGTSHPVSEAPTISSKAGPSTSSNSNSSKRNYHRRKSMLSEVCTPQDLASNALENQDIDPLERSILSGSESWLANPMDEQTPGREAIKGAISSPSSPIISGTADLRECGTERPRMIRMSTSGTQVFSPMEDGIELDGLPVGPERYEWFGERRNKHFSDERQ